MSWTDSSVEILKRLWHGFGHFFALDGCPVQPPPRRRTVRLPREASHGSERKLAPERRPPRDAS